MQLQPMSQVATFVVGITAAGNPDGFFDVLCRTAACCVGGPCQFVEIADAAIQGLVRHLGGLVAPLAKSCVISLSAPEHLSS